MSIFTYLLTYLLTPWTWVLLEKLTCFQLVKKFPAFYGTLRFIAAFTRARNPGPRQVFMFRVSFYGEELSTPRPNPSWRVTPCRLSATAYSIYSHLPFILETVRPSATLGSAMPWWQWPTYHGFNEYTFWNIMYFRIPSRFESEGDVERTWYCRGLRLGELIQVPTRVFFCAFSKQTVNTKPCHACLFVRPS
jgi:hypothetical protein